MRVVDQVYRDVPPSELDEDETETAHVLLFSGKPDEAALVAERIGLRAPCVCPPINDGSSKSHREPSAPGGSTGGLLSRLLSFLIEGFAACGEAPGPGCFGPSEHRDHQDLARGHSEHARGTNVVRWAGSDLPDLDETATNQTMTPTRHTSPIGRFWSRIRRERNVRRTIASLSALDDMTLKDIGLHRSQIGSVARYGNLPV